MIAQNFHSYSAQRLFITLHTIDFDTVVEKVFLKQFLAIRAVNQANAIDVVVAFIVIQSLNCHHLISMFKAFVIAVNVVKVVAVPVVSSMMMFSEYFNSVFGAYFSLYLLPHFFVVFKFIASFSNGKKFVKHHLYAFSQTFY